MKSVAHFNTLLFALIVCLSSQACSENKVYQWEEHNKTYFSDRPHPNARVVELPDTIAHYRVKRVVDGDTLLLDDDTKVRLLGINTPEIAKRNQLAEAGGLRAKAWLKNQLQGQLVRLETDVELRDKYDRSLAHVFTENNEHINQQLIALGLASISIYPPNVKYAEQLLAAEQLAEKQQLGIWADDAYKVKSLADIDPENAPGWQRLRATVVNLRQTRRYYYLDFSDLINCRIHKSNVSLFPNLPSLVGKQLEVRGWFNKQDGQLSMLIRHPSAIKM